MGLRQVPEGKWQDESGSCERKVDEGMQEGDASGKMQVEHSRDKSIK